MKINLNELILSPDVKFLDLNKEVDKVNENLVVINQYPNTSLEEFYKKIEEDYLNCQVDEKDSRHKKILLSSLPSFFYKSDQLILFLESLRCLTRSSHLTTLITVPPIIGERVRATLIRYADYYLQLGKIGEGYTDFCATLTILKEVQVGHLPTRNRGISIWGIKNKKK